MKEHSTTNNVTEAATSAATQKESSIKQITLKGHKGPVLCLDHSSSSIIPPKAKSSHNQCFSDVLLLSGSEDGTARLWDIKSGTRAIKCILAPDKEAVTSVAFYPSNSPIYSVDNKNTSLLSNEYTVYMSCASNVYGYDIRNTTSPILKEYTHDLSAQLQNQDEINQLSFVFAKHGNAPSSTSPCFIAAADDYGQVRISNVNQLETKSNNSAKVFQHAQSDHSAIVTNAIFQPKARHIFSDNSQNLLLASGGTDCFIHLWDLSSRSCYKPCLSYHIEQDTSSGGSSGISQVCNPPMVHSLAFSHSGSILATGLGDGTCVMCRLNDPPSLSQTSSSSKSKSKSKNKSSKKASPKLQLTPYARLRDGHDASVACVHFPRFHLSSSSSVSDNANANNGYIGSEDRLFCSAGNDGAIIFWDLGTKTCGEGALNPFEFFSSTNSRSTQSSDEELSESENARILFGIPHQEKPNWIISSSQTQSGVLPSSLFVADTSNDISAYMMDMI